MAAASDSEVARVPVGVAAQEVVFDKTRRRVFVSSAGDSPNAPPDAVTVIDARTNAVVATFDGGWASVGLARSPRHGLLLVTNFYDGTLRVLRAGSGRLLRTIPVGFGADAVAVVRGR